MAEVPAIFHEIHEFMKQRERTSEAAFNLWSWHPERHRLEMYYGDYADEFVPSEEWVMRETTTLVSYLMGYENKSLEDAMLLEGSHPFEDYRGEFRDPSTGKFHDDWPSKKEFAYNMMRHIKAIHEFSRKRLQP